MPMKAAGGWFESFFGGLYGRVLAKTFDPARTRRQAILIRRLLGLRKGQRVLDIPCGVGRLTIPLARMGLEMTGVDLTGVFLRRARREARSNGARIRFLQADMRRIGFDAEFDAAFNWFTSIGYFTDAEELDFCRRVLRCLRPGGRFLVETMNKTWLLPRFVRQVRGKVGDVEISHRNRWDPATSRTADVWTLRRGRTVERKRISLRLYSGPELRGLLAAAGFRDIRLYGGRSLGGKGRPATVGRLTRHSPRVIAVARRPADGERAQERKGT